MLTDNMVSAAERDGSEFVYALAGSGTDSECGKCFQVQVLDAERQWRDDFPLLLIQVSNSGFDVQAGQFDLYVGGGGFGYYTACNSDCATRFCQGGPCRGPGLYGGSFDQWVRAHYNDPNACYSGGIKWLNETPLSTLSDMCRSLSSVSGRAWKDELLWSSCYRSNTMLLHQNFVSTRYERVRCPPGLVSVSGLRRRDDTAYPFPSPEVSLTRGCEGSRTEGRYCVTTMMDCCVPSCAWAGKVDADPEFPCVYQCDGDGQSFSGSGSGSGG